MPSCNGEQVPAYTIIYEIKVTPTSHIDISCESLCDPENGMVSLVSDSTSLIAEYECNPGYYLIGNASRMCDCNGEWSGSDVTCEGIIMKALL